MKAAIFFFKYMCINRVVKEEVLTFGKVLSCEQVFRVLGCPRNMPRWVTSGAVLKAEKCVCHFAINIAAENNQIQPTFEFNFVNDRGV